MVMFSLGSFYFAAQLKCNAGGEGRKEEARGDLKFACGKTEGRFILNFPIARADLVNVLQRKISDWKYLLKHCLKWPSTNTQNLFSASLLHFTF